MAPKTKEAEQPTALAPVDPSSLFNPNSMESVLAEYGITEGDFYVPAAPTVQTSGFEEICDDHSEVYDDHGNVMKVNGHTPPLMFLGKVAERDSNQYAGYDGYYQFAIWHPTRGKMLISHSRPVGEEEPNVVRFLKSLRAGAVFQVAEFPTRAGFKVYNPIPVQK